MQRFCRTHSHRGSSRAHRLLLARHSLDTDAQRQVVDEHGDCGQCWQDTALALVDAANSLLLRYAGIPDMDGNGNVTGWSVDWLLELIDDHLVCEAADRRDLEQGL
jgi:hypothetical protein